MKRVLVCLLLAFAIEPSLGATTKVVDQGLVLAGVTVISPERSEPQRNVTVVIRGDRIAEIGTNILAGPHAQNIDGRGSFLVPGLIDSHVHLGNMGPLDDDAIESRPELLQAYRAQLPRSYLAFGFTTVVDLDLKPETTSWFSAAPDHPNLCSCGRAVRIVGGYMALKPPKDAAAADAANIIYEPDTKDWPANLNPRDYSPARAVARAIDARATCLKTFIEPGFGGVAHWPTPRAETLAVLRDEAKRQGLVFVVHANALESWRAAIEARADIIAHGIWQWPGDRMSTKPPAEVGEVIRSAAQAHIAVQPTLQAVYGDMSIFDKSLLNDPRLADALPRAVISYLKSDAGGRAQQAMADEYRHSIAHWFGSDSVDPARAMAVAPARATATLRMMRSEDVRLIFGTDTPSNQGIGNPPGLNGRLEIGHWKDAGISLSEILRAATSGNAEAFGLSDRGTVQPGKRADLLLLGKNPLETIEAYDSINTIIVNGKPIPRSDLLPRQQLADGATKRQIK